jgi:hypothetical protein
VSSSAFAQLSPEEFRLFYCCAVGSGGFGELMSELFYLF